MALDDFMVTDVLTGKQDDAIVEAINEQGIVFFQQELTNTQILEASRRLGYVIRHRSADTRGLTEIRNSILLENAFGPAYSEGSVDWHTDSAGLDMPPHLILFYCKRPAENGGANRFVHGADFHDWMAEHQQDQLQHLYTSEVDFLTTDGPVGGHILTPQPDGTVVLRFRTGYNIWMPSKIKVRPMRRAIQEVAQEVLLGPNQGFIENNRAMMHYREGHEGADRLVYRTMMRTRPDRLSGRIDNGFRPSVNYQVAAGR